MNEITRFRIARPPAAAAGYSLKAFYYPALEDKSIFGCTPDRQFILEKIYKFVKSTSYIATSVHVVQPCAFVHNGLNLHPEAKVLAVIAHFLTWLEDKAGERTSTSTACLDWLVANASDLLPEGKVSTSEIALAIVQREEWKAFRVAVGDSLIAAIVVGINQDQIDYLTRLFRAISLVELLATNSLPDSDTASVQQVVIGSFVILPPWLQEVHWLSSRRTDLPLFTRAPAFSDLIVVREEWSCYVLGEIAHIENVMKGEKKVRTHERMEEVETKQEEESTTTNFEERDNQTTDRQSLKEESQKQTQLEIGVEGQIDTSGQYGPTRVNTHLGARLSYSVQESRNRASEQSREIVNRAVSRVETKVRELRSTRALRRITEYNNHTLDNTAHPDSHVTGIYRWVDRIVNLQEFRYPHRYLLEFEIPEPAAHYRWLQTNAPTPNVLVPKPPPFVVLHPNDDVPKPLLASDITTENYTELAGRFGATGVLPPPDSEISVSAAIPLKAKEEGQPHGRDELIEFAPRISGKMELTIPTNYHVVKAIVSVAAHPTLGRWRDQPDDSPDGYVGVVSVIPPRPPYSLGYHNITAAFTLAGKTLKLSTFPEDITVRGDVHIPLPRIVDRHLQYSEAWMNEAFDIPLDGFGTTQLDVCVVVGGTFEAVASVNVSCKLLDSAYQSWQLETYDRLWEAHRTAEENYRDALVTAQIRREDTFAQRSPQRNAEIVREELKRQVIEMLMRETLFGYSLIENFDDAPPKRPLTKLSEAAAVAPLIQFLEQAFEWNNMTYIMYPYYWTDDKKWNELQMIEGSDADFVRFLRSGSARVIVPARRGYEPAVMYFSIFGQPWSGGVPPIPGDELYVSVAQEIQEMTGAPDDGEPGKLWQARLPTTLVALDSDSVLPKHNENPRLRGEPTVNLCKPVDKRT